MKYIEYPNRAAAELRSHNEMKKSSGYRPENVTQFRWGVVENEDTGDVALVIPVEEIDRLDDLEKSQAIDRVTLEAKDACWFKTDRAEFTET